MLRVHKINRPTFVTLCSASFLQRILVDLNDAGKLVREDHPAEVLLAEDSHAAVKGDGSKLMITEDSLAEDSPTEDSLTEDSLAEDSPTEDSLAEDSPKEDALAEDYPTEDLLVEDKPTEDSRAEDYLAALNGDESKLFVAEKNLQAAVKQMGITEEHQVGYHKICIFGEKIETCVH